MKRFQGFALTVILSLAASPLLAAQAEHGEEHASGGLPQFDPHWWPSQIFWLAVCFTVLYTVFAKSILPDIAGVLENRRSHIDGNIAEAERLKAEAEAAQKAYETGLDQARADAARAVAAVNESMKALADKQAVAFRAAMDERVAALETNLAQARADAMADMNRIVAEVASDAAKKIVGISLDPKKARTVVESLNRREAA